MKQVIFVLILLCISTHAQSNRTLRNPTSNILLTCPAPQGCDNSDNDPAFWNAAYWWDPVHKGRDLNEVAIDLRADAQSLCSGAVVQMECLLFLDLDQDGDWETVVNTAQPQQPNTVYFGNAKLPNYQGGEARGFDQRSVADPALDRYRFALQLANDGVRQSAALRFVAARRPDQYQLPVLPHGTHKIRWIATDSCGNQNSCEQTFTIKDCRAPGIVCRDLSVNIFSSRMLNLWASDLLESVSDNATPVEQISLAIGPKGQAPGVFPVNPNTGQPNTGMSFSCSDIGDNTLYLWAQDAAGNAGYCTAKVVLQDLNKVCEPKAIAAIYVKTLRGSPMPEVSVSSRDIQVGIVAYTLTNDNGFTTINFNDNIPLGPTAEICADYDENPANGVDVKDLLAIGKHILGLCPLKGLGLYAADANKSGTITTFDQVELKKLILGLYNELPNQHAWTFFDKTSIPDSPFNPANPAWVLRHCAKMRVDSFFTDTTRFTGVKIGDLDNSAAPDGPMDTLKGIYYIDVADRLVQAGETVEVEFTAGEAISGQQFTLDYPNLQLLELVPGNETNLLDFALFGNKSCTHAWISPSGNTRPSFRIRFRVLSTDLLSRHLLLSGRRTPAVAYRTPTPTSCEAERYAVALRFLTVDSPEPANVADRPALYPNRPNPFSEATQLEFYLPEAAAATLRVTDATGRLLWQNQADYTAGRHTLLLDGKMLPAAGLYYCTLQTGNFTLNRIIGKHH